MKHGTPELKELKPRIIVCGIGGAGGNAVNNMIRAGLGIETVAANTDAQALTKSEADHIIQMGLKVTEGLGAGSHPEVGRAAAEEAIEEIKGHLAGAHMCFVTAGMGGGTGTGAAPVIARTAREMGILTVGVVTKPFSFEGARRMRVAEAGITELQKAVDTLIVIPNQNLFRVANERTTFADAFSMADQVLYSGVACITDLMVKEGLINLDFADVRAVMREMGKAMMGTGEASGDRRAVLAAEAAIANPLLDDISMRGARGLLISITGGNDLTLYEVDEAASRIRQEVDEDANIILGATFDHQLDGTVRVSVVATGIDTPVASLSREKQDGVVRETKVSRAISPKSAGIEAAHSKDLAAFQAHFETKEETMSPQAFTLAPPPSADFHDFSFGSSPPAPISRAATAEDLYEDHEHFLPPAPEEAIIRPARIPSLEEIPFPNRGEARPIGEGQLMSESHPAQQRRTLLERLTSFGRSSAQSSEPVKSTKTTRSEEVPARIHQEVVPRRPTVKRQSQAPALVSEEDDLEIPAFLRRQSN